MEMNEIFVVGDRIHGFCNGYFGRDDYESKVCIMVSRKYAVFQYDDGTASVLNASSDDEMRNISEDSKEWRKPDVY